MTFDSLPPRRGYRWNGVRWVSIRVDRAMRAGAIVGIILCLGVIAVGLLASLLPVLS